MHRIGENPLARMKRVSTLGRQWLLRLATRSRLRFVAPRFQQRQIFNRPGLSEDCIVKGGIVVRAGNLGHGERKKNLDTLKFIAAETAKYAALIKHVGIKPE